jgi:outer membrane immunogenic protein
MWGEVMKTQLIFFWVPLAVVVCIARTAAAADLPPSPPVYKAAPAAAPFDWSGFYVGANAGYGWGDPRDTMAGDVDGGAGSGVINSLFDPSLDSLSDLTYPLSIKTSGAVGGAQFGFNWQFGSQWLTGVETDFQFSGIRGSSHVAEPGSIGSTYALSASQNLDWFGTLRARLGYLLTDRVLLYGTGGLAYGETKASAAVAETGIGIDFPPGFPTTLLCPPATVCLAGSQSHVSAGWTAGGGIEFAAWNHVSFKVEYLHVDLGAQNQILTTQAPATGTAFAVMHLENAFDIVRGGVNFHF